MLLRQGIVFVLVGALQVVVDSAVFGALFWSGVASVPANLAGRACGAIGGFVLNGRITFARDGQAQLGGRRFARYLALWVVMTLASTLLVANAAVRLPPQWVVLAKPAIEVGLAAVSFVVARGWVYR